jgi:serine/threonine-protein kinase
VQVPDLVGKDESKAANELGKLGLEVDIKEEANDDKIPGTVLRQNPGPGESLEAGQTVTIVVAVASDTVAVPLLIGMNQASAEALLTSMGLVADPQPIQSTEPGGQVVDQNPKEGEKVDHQSAVTIYVSNAPEETTVKVPSVAGLTQAQAVAKLATFELKPKITPWETADFEPGVVIQQDPPAGVTVDKGSSVELLIAVVPTTTTTTTTTEPPTTTTTMIIPPSTETTFTTDF